MHGSGYAGRLNCLRIHDLRHSHASFLVSAGFSLPTIGALLGHSQPQTTARYAHLLDDPLKKAVERVGAIITGGEGGSGAARTGGDLKKIPINIWPKSSIF